MRCGSVVVVVEQQIGGGIDGGARRRQLANLLPRTLLLRFAHHLSQPLRLQHIISNNNNNNNNNTNQYLSSVAHSNVGRAQGRAESHGDELRVGARQSLHCCYAYALI
jgi:hypothetical protein